MKEAQDLRSFIGRLESMGEIKTIEEADWNLEIGGLTELLSEKRGPALLFDRIKDYPPGFRVLTNPLGTQTRLASVLGLDINLRGLDLLNAWRMKLRDFKPMPVTLSEGGPVFENTMADGEVDLFRFPAPIWHELDGGRYIGTGCSVVTKDPESGHINVGTYRCQVQGKNRITVKMDKGKHGRMAQEKYHQAGRACPVVISLGGDPWLFLAASLPLSLDTSEYEFTGWLQGAPFPVVPGPITGLPIPATAEIVIEGEIPPYGPEKLPQEGPFGEWPGYYTNTTVGEVPIMEVARVYYRNDPILLGVPTLKSPNQHLPIPLSAASLWDQLEKAGIPEVKGVWGFVYGSTGPFTVVAIRQRYAGHAKQTALVACGAKAGVVGGKFVVVVDDDVDITDLQDVIWAMSTRCNVREAVDIVKGVWTTPVEPAVRPSSRSLSGNTMDRVLIDACRPYQWLDEFPPVNAYSKEFKRRLAEKWQV
jgi:4-hydroxy-3-polyprenylbenzoate decarboxylase